MGGVLAKVTAVAGRAPFLEWREIEREKIVERETTEANISAVNKTQKGK